MKHVGRTKLVGLSRFGVKPSQARCWQARKEEHRNDCARSPCRRRSDWFIEASRSAPSAFAAAACTPSLGCEHAKSARAEIPASVVLVQPLQASHIRCIRRYLMATTSTSSPTRARSLPGLWPPVDAPLPHARVVARAACGRTRAMGPMHARLTATRRGCCASTPSRASVGGQPG